MADLFADQEVTVKCPKCRKPITQMLSRFRTPGNCCPHCLTPLPVENINKALNVANNLNDKITNFFRRFSGK